MVNTDESPTMSNGARVALGVMEVLKSALWPVLVLGIFVSLYRPLSALLNELPNVIGRADVVTIGDIAIKLNKTLEAKASPEIREALRHLDDDSLRRLLRVNGIFLNCRFTNISDGDLRFDEQKRVDDKLVAIGLFEKANRADDNDDKRTDCYHVEPAPLGKSAQDFLIGVIASSVGLSLN